MLESPGSALLPTLTHLGREKRQKESRLIFGCVRDHLHLPGTKLQVACTFPRLHPLACIASLDHIPDVKANPGAQFDSLKQSTKQ